MLTQDAEGAQTSRGRSEHEPSAPSLQFLLPILVLQKRLLSRLLSGAVTVDHDSPTFPSEAEFELRTPLPEQFKSMRSLQHVAFN
jgi:hypothetical protein